MDKFKLIAILTLLLHLPAGASMRSEGGDSPLDFAFVTDVHVSVGAKSVDWFRRCISDLNEQKDLDFVIFGGDMTDFGSDEEIYLVKSIMDSLQLRHYVLAGNHDCNWSESGCNTFLNVFGYEQFEFEEGGWRFIGCNSGPDMRMSPALVPHESEEWLRGLEGGKKSIFINHYPMDSSVLNWFDVNAVLKSLDVRFCIGGHWHRNTALEYDGIPAVLGRSGLPSGAHSGYSLVHLENDRVSVRERRLYANSAVTLAPWYVHDLAKVEKEVPRDADGLPEDYPWMRYDVNREYPQVREVWKTRDEYNIVAGSAVSGDAAYYTTASGYVRAISLKDGSRLWSRKFPGKIYSTPAVEGRILVFGCSDGNIYALDTRDGKELWTRAARKSVVACPLIRGGRVYIGASDGCFRCLNLSDGSPVWTFEGVEGHVVSTPYVDDTQVVFGSWGRTLYSLDPQDGSLQWKWTVDKGSRMYSPASTVPLKADGKIFVAVPDRRVYAVNASTGSLEFVVEGGRDAIGQSEDGNMIYSKTMFHKAWAIHPSSPEKIWEKENMTGYEIAPTALVEKDGVLLIPTCKGSLVAMDSASGDFLWAHKLSLALVNPLQVWNKGKNMMVLATTMDGTVTLLSIPRR